ncbi:MAG TPA: ATP synthase F1 subunit delta [Chroococcidiopsis sp.]
MKDSLASSEICEPYAQALMSLAQANDLVDRVGEDVSYLLSLLAESDDLSAFLSSPLMRQDVKKGVLRQVVGEQVHPYVLSFLMLLVDRGRILFLDGVCRQFQAMLRTLRQTVLAEVITAVELTDEQQDAIRTRVKSMVSANQVDLDITLNPELIGGVIIKVGSQVIDLSITGQLRRIGLRLSSAT